MGAFLSGAGAVLGGVGALKRVRKTERNDCDRRIAEIREALREGIKIGGKR